jgi:spermidine synthase
MAPPTSLRIDATTLKYLDAGLLPELFRFARDVGRVEAPVNRLNDQKLVGIYSEEWSSWSR